MKEYKVGQVLFVISEKTTKIIPVQVVEEVTRKNMKGSQITYTVKLPDKEMSHVDINDIKGEIFNSITLLREKMMSNATNAINKMIEKTTKIVNSTFDTNLENFITTENFSEINENLNDNVHLSDNDDIIKVDLGNGQYANMKTDNLKALEGA